MACSWSDPLDCVGPPIGPEDIVNSGVAAFARAISDGIAAIVKTTITWWVDVPSIDLTNESTIVEKIRMFLLPVAVAVAVAGVIYSGIRMTLTRKADPLIDVGRGLFMTAFWSATGVAVPAALLQFSDVLASWILDSSTGGKFGERMTVLFSAAALSPAPGVTIGLGFAVILAAALQAILMIFREGSVIILSGVIVLAAAGQFNPITKPWLRKVSSWMLALVFFKPAAALVYATCFVMIGEGKGIRATFMGFAMLVLSLGSLPALMKFFNWTTGAIDSGGGGMAGILGAAGGGLHALSWGSGGGGGGGDDSGGGGGGSDAVSHARYLEQTMSSQSSSSAAPTSTAPTGAADTIGTTTTSTVTGSAPQASAAASTSTAAAAGTGTAATGTAAAGGAAATGAAAGGGTAAVAGASAAAAAPATGGISLAVGAGVAAVGAVAKAAEGVKNQALGATEGN